MYAYFYVCIEYINKIYPFFPIYYDSWAIMLPEKKIKLKHL